MHERVPNLGHDMNLVMLVQFANALVVELVQFQSGMNDFKVAIFIDEVDHFDIFGYRRTLALGFVLILEHFFIQLKIILFVVIRVLEVALIIFFMRMIAVL